MTDEMQPTTLGKKDPTRASVLKRGMIVCDGRDSPLECLIFDLSNTGADLRVAEGIQVPESFELQIVSGSSHACRLEWQNADRASVVFTDVVDEPESNPTERRQHKRQLVLRKGQIVFNSGFARIGCLVLDETAAGAKLRPEDSLSCPEVFELHVEGAAPRKCVVVRRHGDDLGVRFLDTEA